MGVPGKTEPYYRPREAPVLGQAGKHRNYLLADWVLSMETDQWQRSMGPHSTQLPRARLGLLGNLTA